MMASRARPYRDDWKNMPRSRVECCVGWLFEHDQGL